MVKNKITIGAASYAWLVSMVITSGEEVVLSFITALAVFLSFRMIVQIDDFIDSVNKQMSAGTYETVLVAAAMWTEHLDEIKKQQQRG